METLRIGLPALVAIAVYLAGINVLGAWLGRGQKDAGDYFLGGHAMPWWAVMASIVATETSALTFLSVPGDAYRTGFTFLQLAFGYLVGRIAVSFILLPGYFHGEITTAYALLERRFGVGARRFTSLIFMVTRVMAASVRLAVPAIPIALILGIPVWAAILAPRGGHGALHVPRRHQGGHLDRPHPGARLPLGRRHRARLPPPRRSPAASRSVLAAGARAGVSDFSCDLSEPYTLWAGVIGGSFLAMASHGADQLIVQRLLACRGLRDAQKALIGSGVLVIAAVRALPDDRRRALRLLRRAADRAGRTFASTSDEIFPTFIVAPPAAVRLGLPRRRDLLGGDVLGVLGPELARLRAGPRHRGAALREGAPRGPARARGWDGS